MEFSIVWLSAFWLATVAALIAMRLFRARRQEVLAGSLLIWRRLAEQPQAPPRKILFDLSFFLQAAAMLLLIAALGEPKWNSGGSGRALLLVVDNGPLARARWPQARPAWEHLRSQAAELLAQLEPVDRVLLMRAAPSPKLLTPERGVSPGEAVALLGTVVPALSSPAPDALLLAATDAGRRAQPARPLTPLVLSLRAPPPGGQASRRRLAPGQDPPSNTALVACGSAQVIDENNQSTAQILVRVKNFSPRPVSGSVKLGTTPANPAAQELPCRLEAFGEEALVFTLAAQGGVGVPARHVRLAWSSPSSLDALPEDDVVLAAPRALAAPKVRLHGAAADVAALDRLFRSAFQVAPLSADDPAAADLEVYARSVPAAEAWARCPARAILLLAPRSGFESVFETGPQVLEQPVAQLGEKSRLTEGIRASPDSPLFAVPQAVELARTGDFTTLIKDAKSGRALVAQFLDSRRRPGFVFAFMPGAGLAAERKLDPPLAALLVRLALLASDAGEPFQAQRAAERELASGEALPQDWAADRDWSNPAGAGVLDELASDLLAQAAAGPDPGDERGAPSGAELFAAAAATGLLAPIESGGAHALAPWLIALALLLLALDLRRAAR